MNYLEPIRYILQPLIIVFLTVLLLVFKRKRLDANLITFILVAITGALLLKLPLNGVAFDFIDSEWNWEGKILIVFLSIVCIWILKKHLPKEKVGLTLKQNSGSLIPALIFTTSYLFLITVGSLFFHNNLPNSISTEGILWNFSILPDFSEELFERGVLLVLLNNIFDKKWYILGAKIGIGFILICLLFALEHSLSLDNLNHLNFNYFHFFRTLFISGFTFAWLKERTGSLVFPTIAHFGSEAILTLIILFAI